MILSVRMQNARRKHADSLLCSALYILLYFIVINMQFLTLAFAQENIIATSDYHSNRINNHSLRNIPAIAHRTSRRHLATGRKATNYRPRIRQAPNSRHVIATPSKAFVAKAQKVNTLAKPVISKLPPKPVFQKKQAFESIISERDTSFRSSNVQPLRPSLPIATEPAPIAFKQSPVNENILRSSFTASDIKKNVTVPIESEEITPDTALIANKDMQHIEATPEVTAKEDKPQETYALSDAPYDLTVPPMLHKNIASHRDVIEGAKSYAAEPDRIILTEKKFRAIEVPEYTEMVTATIELFKNRPVPSEEPATLKEAKDGFEMPEWELEFWDEEASTDIVLDN